jgi:hypothetical protein
VSRLRTLQLPQKVALVIGLAAAVTFLGVYVATDGFRGLTSVWFDHPGAVRSTGTYLVVRRFDVGRMVIFPMLLIASWTAFTVWLLGTASDAGADD